MKPRLLRRSLPTVAIVGRPNVGKSTLFNRITQTRRAAVLDTPGLTRDRNYHDAEYAGTPFLLIDTGGYEPEPHESIARGIRQQTLFAVEEADAIIFLLDLHDPLNPTDDEVLSILRRTRKPVLTAVNKCDNPAKSRTALADFMRFGLDHIYPVSSLHGTGLDSLLADLVEQLPAATEPDPDFDEGTRIAVVGRPNVGKSTLVNQILGYERTIASPVPGTTRDSVDTTFQQNGRTYTLVDTAGIRRRGKVELGAEKLSVLASLKSLQRCDVALILIDAIDGLTEQDAHVAGYAADAGCATILVVNKWDAIEKTTGTAGAVAKHLVEELGFLKHAPIIQISALTGQRVPRLFQMVDEVERDYRLEIPTVELNEWLKRTLRRNSPPIRSGKALKIKYITQTGSAPPAFTLFVNDPQLIHFSYERFLLNQLREAYGFAGVPIRLHYRKKAEDPEWLKRAQSPQARTRKPKPRPSARTSRKKT